MHESRKRCSARCTTISSQESKWVWVIFSELAPIQTAHSSFRSVIGWLNRCLLRPHEKLPRAPWKTCTCFWPHSAVLDSGGPINRSRLDGQGGMDQPVRNKHGKLTNSTKRNYRYDEYDVVYWAVFDSEKPGRWYYNIDWYCTACIKSKIQKSHGFIDPMLDQDKVSAIVVLQGKTSSSCSQARATSHGENSDFNRFPQQPSANLKTIFGLV